MMKSRRSEKAQESIKREISLTISSMKDSRLHDDIITVSKVDVSGDFSFCKAYISCLKGINHSRKICKVLNFASGYIQNTVSRNLKTRSIIKILFIPCDSEEYAFKMNDILNNMHSSSLEKISDFLINNDNYEILTHEIPDGDAIGSSLSLYFALKQINKNVKITFDNEIPDNLKFMFEHLENDNFESRHLICLDVSDANRMFGLNDRDVQICIDHHEVDNCKLANMIYIDKKSSSCAGIIYDLIKKLNVSIDEKIATAVYVGISGDTGRFKYSNVSSKDFKDVYEIFDRINDFSGLNHRLSGGLSKNFIKFQSEVMKNFEFIGSCCISTVSLEMLNSYGVSYSEIKPIYNIPLTIKDIDFSITIKQKEENLVRVSLRSLNNGKSLEFAKMFNGGGHSDAAGFEICGDLDYARKLILDKLENFCD